MLLLVFLAFASASAISAPFPGLHPVVDRAFKLLADPTATASGTSDSTPDPCMIQNAPAIQAIELDPDCTAFFNRSQQSSMDNQTMEQIDLMLNTMCNSPCLPKLVSLAQAIITCEAAQGSADPGLSDVIEQAFKFECTVKPGAVDKNGLPVYCLAYMQGLQDQSDSSPEYVCAELSGMGCCLGSLLSFLNSTLSDIPVQNGSDQIPPDFLGMMIMGLCNLTVEPPPCPDVSQAVEVVMLTLTIDGVSYDYYIKSPDNEIAVTYALQQDIAATLGVDPSQVSISKISAGSGSKYGLHLMASSITVNAIVIPVGTQTAAALQAKASTAISGGTFSTTNLAKLPAEALDGPVSVSKSSSASEGTAGGLGNSGSALSVSLAGLAAILAFSLF